MTKNSFLAEMTFKGRQKSIFTKQIFPYQKTPIIPCYVLLPFLASLFILKNFLYGHFCPFLGRAMAYLLLTREEEKENMRDVITMINFVITIAAFKFSLYF